MRVAVLAIGVRSPVISVYAEVDRETTERSLVVGGFARAAKSSRVKPVGKVTTILPSAGMAVAVVKATVAVVTALV